MVRLIFALILWVCVGAVANAAGATFGNRADFDTVAFAAGLHVQIEGWDGFATETIIPNGSIINGLTYSLHDPQGDDTLATLTANFISAPNVLGVFNEIVGLFVGIDTISTLRIEFPTPILAWGVWINTGDRVPDGIRARTDTGLMALSGLDPFPPGNDFGQFVGLINDEPFSWIEVSAARDGFSFALDDMRYAFVPSPGAGSVLVFGSVAMIRRRQRGRVLADYTLDYYLPSHG